MTEDEELLTRKKLLDLCHLFRRDSWDGVAFILFYIAFNENTGGRFEAGKHYYRISELSLPVQHDQASQADKYTNDVDP